MDFYYVNQNAQSDGYHEVHKSGCSCMPLNCISLGYCTDCADAVRKAKVYYTKVDGCYYCCRSCHTR